MDHGSNGRSAVKILTEKYKDLPEIIYQAEQQNMKIHSYTLTLADVGLYVGGAPGALN